MTWNFGKPKLITRGVATKEKLWNFAPPIEKEEEELWDFAPPKIEPKLPRLQDIAKIMPKAEEAKKTMGLEYIPAKVVSVLAEKPLYATGEFSAKLLKMGFNAIGLKKIGEFFEKSEEIWKHPPVTKKVQQQTAYLRQQSYDRSFTEGVIFDVTDATTQLMGLLTQMVVAKKIPSFSGKDIYTHIKAMATHAVVTTPGSLEERTQAALYRVGYSITPFIVNKFGATGLTAVATDTLLNTFLTSPTYAKALKQSDNIQEFLQIAIPQLVMDIGMAWNTRGLPANQRDAMINRYIKTQSRKMGVTIDEYKKIIEVAEKIEAKVEVPEIKPEVKPVTEGKARVVYRTEKAAFPYKGVSIWGEGLYFGIYKGDVARMTVERGGRWTKPKAEDYKKVKEYVLPSDIKLKTVDIEEWIKENKGTLTPEGEKINLLNRGEILKSQVLAEGYDGVEILTDRDMGKGFDQIIIYNKDIINKIIPTAEKPAIVKPEIKPEVGVKPEELITPEEIGKMVEYEKDEISQLATGREKMRIPVDTKTEWMEALGKGKYMQIFRDNRNLQSPDEMASSLGISENELREQIVDRIRYKPEKMISPEGIVIGEVGSVFIPSMAEVQNIGTKIASKLSIEAPFIKAGAKETGFQVKNYFSNIGLAHGQGLAEINKLNKFNLEVPTVKESGFKASGKIDYTDLTYLSERPEYFGRLTPEERALVSPAKKIIKDFYKGWEDKLKEIGWMEEPFPKSLITRNNKTIGNLKASLPRLKTAEARAKAEAEIVKLQGQNDRIKKQKIQFVSVPAKIILAKADTDPILRDRIMSILPHWGRTTVTVKDLVDTGIISRQEADARVIIGEYCDRMGRKYSLGKIFENAEKEGLIKSAAEKPDWPTARIIIKGQHVSIPQLRGKRLDPFFSDVITDFFGREKVTLSGIFGITKMMQFYNPLFLPMYDVWQSAVTGALISPKAPKYILQGIKDSFKKTDNYWLAFENGTFSKPYAIPYDKFEYQFKEAMKDNKLGDFIKKAALPTNWIPMLYNASWHTAWKLDETVRMMTFNYLKDQGMSDREAGQLSALFHSDYASVPPRTRKMLNKVFFTPTFKITMGKLYLNMLKGGAKVLTKGKGATQSEKILARGAVLATAGMMGISAYFASQGYEEVEKFRKYVKTIETDEGLKENVITLANPFNIPWRYYYRVKSAFKPWTINNAEKLLQVTKWDLHPIHRVVIDIVDNYNWSVYNNYDDIGKIAFDIGLKTAGELVKITQWMLESAEAGEIKAENIKALQKDFGKFEAIILKPFIFNYLREVKEKRRAWALNKLQNDFRFMMSRSPSKDPKVNYERLQNYYKRVQETYKEFK